MLIANLDCFFNGLQTQKFEYIRCRCYITPANEWVTGKYITKTRAGDYMRNQYHSITHFLDRWLPDYTEQRSSSMVENRIRARILVGLFFSAMLIVATTLLLFLLMHVFTDKNFIIAIIVLSIAAVLLLVQTFMFYRVANVSASAIIFSMTFFGTTLAVMIFTGGWSSPTRLLFFCAPMISFLVDGRREGFYITALVLICGLLMFIAQKAGWQFFQVIDGKNGAIVEVIMWIISINIMVTCLAVYDAVLHDLSGRVIRHDKPRAHDHSTNIQF